jgi:hypothetical protein
MPSQDAIGNASGKDMVKGVFGPTRNIRVYLELMAICKGFNGEKSH